MKTGASFQRGQSKQDYATPRDFRLAVRYRFGCIETDLAASLENTLARDFISQHKNSLVQNWAKMTPGLCFLNPPFDNIAPWAAKCAAEAKLGARILLLTPASIGTNWFAEHVWGNALVLALRPRLCFDGKNPYPKDVMLSCFNLGDPGFECWKWI